MLAGPAGRAVGLNRAPCQCPSGLGQFRGPSPVGRDGQAAAQHSGRGPHKPGPEGSEFERVVIGFNVSISSNITLFVREVKPTLSQSL